MINKYKIREEQTPNVALLFFYLFKLTRHSDVVHHIAFELSSPEGVRGVQYTKLKN